MKVRIKKKLLKESNTQGVDLGYSDIENVRIMIGKNIDRAVLTPSDGVDDLFDDEAEEEEEQFGDEPVPEMTKKDYINRIRDVVKDGRKIPYLYYAYKGIDDKGNILNQNDLSPVLELQIKKAGMLVTRLEHSGDASVDLFLCDFGKILEIHDEWDKKYEERIRDLLPTRTYDRMALKKGYNRAAYQAGRNTNLRPFSTVSIGRGSKPVFHQNVDFMYKTSHEPNRKIDPNDLWAFSIRVPLAMAYMILSKMGMPSRPSSSNPFAMIRYKEARKQVARERLKLTPQKIIDAYNHWNTNKDSYIEKYIKVMQQEPNSWTQYYDVSRIKNMIKMNFESFNSNYVESERVGDFEREKQEFTDKFGPHWADTAKPELLFYAMMIQPPPLKLEVQEGFLDKLEDQEMAKKLAKNVMGTMVNLKNGELKKNYITNLLELVQAHKNEPGIKNNITWIQEAINMYYIMGGK